MVDVSAIAGAISGLKATKDIVQAMIGLRDAEAFRAKAIELQTIIMDAQTSVFEANEERSALIDRVKEMEEQIVRMETWGAEKQRYELKQVSRLGAFAYVVKQSAADSDPLHCICATCYENGKKSVLQVTSTLSGNRERLFHCQTCSADIPFTKFPPE